MAEPIVKLEGVSKRYEAGKLAAQILHEVDLEVQRGERLAIVGTSGSGKSTLLNIIGGLDRGYQGRVTVAGQELAQLSDKALSQLRNRQVGFVFQQFNLLEHLSCKENVAIPAIFSQGADQQVSERALRALARVGMDSRADDLPSNLSGGQKQRVAIARSLFSHPPLLLCDEPTGNLDTRTGQQIIELFTELNERDGITLIIVTHEARISQVAHRVLRLEDGWLAAEQGEPESRIGQEVQS